MLGLTNDKIASAEEVSGAIVAIGPELTAALTELDKVSHLGAYNLGLQLTKNLCKRLSNKIA